MYDYILLFGMFVILGFSTFLMRAIFLFNFPTRLNNQQIRKALESVPSSLLVALVIPYTFFIETKLSIFRIEVLILVLAVPIIKYLKKPGMSLVLTLTLLMLFNLFYK